MRQQKTPGTSFATAQPAPWMKPAFVVLAMVFIISGVLLWQEWENAQADLAVQSKTLKAKTEANAELKAHNTTTGEYLQKFSKDPEFQNRIARERLNYASPDEIIIKLDPAPPATKPATTTDRETPKK